MRTEALARLLLAASMTVVVLPAVASPSLAECTLQRNRWPAFDQVAPTARQVVIGRVTSTNKGNEVDDSPIFTLEVEEVLRGTAPAVIEVSSLRSGLPLRGFQACRRDATLMAGPGDRIALALGGRIPGIRGRVNTAAWIEGGPATVTNPGLRRMEFADVIGAAASQPLEATRTRDGVRMTMTLDGPLVAGQPTRVWTRATNVGDQEIWWNVSAGISVSATMPDARWRIGEPTVDLPAYGEPGFPATIDLKNAITCDPGCDRVTLDFVVKRVNGKAVDHWGSDVGKAERIAPGESIVFVHEWDGDARLATDEALVGLPPDGPVRISATTYFSVPPEGRSRALEATIRTSVTGGRDDERLHPFEVVDAALADPAFADMMATRDFNRFDTGYLTYVDELDRWFVGSCGRPEDAEVQEWHLAEVDPVSGEVLGFIEGAGDESCDPLTWPAPSEHPAPGGEIQADAPDLVTSLVDAVTSLPGRMWPDAPVPESLAAFLPSAREQLWDHASEDLRIPLHLRFLEARCGSAGGVALIFEELGPPYFGGTYAYAVRGSMPTSPDDAWGGGYGVRSVFDDPEFVHLMGEDTGPCP